MSIFYSTSVADPCKNCLWEEKNCIQRSCRPKSTRIWIWLKKKKKIRKDSKKKLHPDRIAKKIHFNTILIDEITFRFWPGCWDQTRIWVRTVEPTGSDFWLNSGSATLPARAGLAEKKSARDRVEVIKKEKAPYETEIIRSKMENA